MGENMTFRRVILESPFAAPTDELRDRNLRYLRALALFCLGRGESPYASHAMLTRWLDDCILEQRELGINAGLAWACAAEKAVVGMDLGVSDGMHYGILRHRADNRPIEFVRLGPGWERWSAQWPRSTVSFQPVVSFNDYVDYVDYVDDEASP